MLDDVGYLSVCQLLAISFQDSRNMDYLAALCCILLFHGVSVWCELRRSGLNWKVKFSELVTWIWSCHHSAPVAWPVQDKSCDCAIYWLAARQGVCCSMGEILRRSNENPHASHRACQRWYGRILRALESEIHRLAITPCAAFST